MKSCPLYLLLQALVQNRRQGAYFRLFRNLYDCVTLRPLFPQIFWTDSTTALSIRTSGSQKSSSLGFVDFSGFKKLPRVTAPKHLYAQTCFFFETALRTEE